MYALWSAFGVFKNQHLWLRCVVLDVLSIALPVLFFEFLESPMIKLGARIANRLTLSGPAMRWLDRISAGWTRSFTFSEINAQGAEESVSTPNSR